jgi:hypothetical protein
MRNAWSAASVGSIRRASQPSFSDSRRCSQNEAVELQDSPGGLQPRVILGVSRPRMDTGMEIAEIAKLVLEYLLVLIWPVAVLAIVLAFRKQLVGLLARIRHAELPGGVAIDLVQEIQEAKAPYP